jgi:hypothetical protein
MGEQLVKEVVTKLTDNLVENIRVVDIRHNGALMGEVSELHTGSRCMGKHVSGSS